MNETTVSVYPDAEEKKYIRKRYSAAGLAVLVDLAVFQIVSRLFMLIVGAVSGAEGSISEILRAGQTLIASNDYTSVLFSIGFPIIAEVTAIIIAVKMLGLDLKSKFTREGYNLGEVAGGSAVGFFFQTVAVFIVMLLYFIVEGSTEGATDSTIVQKSSLGANIILYFYVCAFGPLLEELLFRGIILESMKMYSCRFAVVFSSVIFGLMHGNAAQAINGFLIGLVLGALYVRSDSLVPCTLMHMIMNTVTSVCSVLIYSDPDIIEKLTAGDISALSGFPAAGVIINLLIRFLTFPAGLTVLIVAGTKGFGLMKANAAGKHRAAPLVLTTVTWIIVIVGYLGVIVYNF
ncbi:MAG: CPBP family intramembrane metalloprotease [Oscillospiraceae bacterium]|nr:CPBP family intramembrane metalloprotease [Oscillospiraceae bacterium]